MSDTERGRDGVRRGEAPVSRSPFNIVLVGLPGSGKGTQGAHFARRHGIPTISTGDMLRAAVARGTALGREVEATLAAGGLVPDPLIIRVVESRLAEADTATGFILDGFPRTLPQAMALDAVVRGRGPLVVIYLDVSPEVILHRILSRRVCESCGQADTGAPTTEYCASCGGGFVKRADDQEAVVRRRVAEYVENTAPLVEWYRQRGTFRAIDGDGPLAEVARAFEAAVLSAAQAPPQGDTHL